MRKHRSGLLVYPFMDSLGGNASLMTDLILKERLLTFCERGPDLCKGPCINGFIFFTLHTALLFQLSFDCLLTWLTMQSKQIVSNSANFLLTIFILKILLRMTSFAKFMSVNGLKRKDMPNTV